ncbi:MAG TPA: hypothetical protein VKT49_00755 [Bryobacteraceae bacterium]|nr:hypothetical protein [Bryobacteraceae bacterium]
MRPVGSGLSGADLGRAGPVTPAPKVTAPSGTGLDSTAAGAALLQALSEPDLARLVAVLEPARNAPTAARINELVEAVMTAAAASDVERAVQEAAHLTALDPARVEALRAEPTLAPIRVQLDALLPRLGNVAKLDAESRIAEATQLVEQTRITALPEWDAPPETLLAIANRLLETGSYINAVQAAHVAQVVVDGARWAPAVSGVAAPGLSGVGSKPEVSPVSPRGPILSALRESWRIVSSHAPGRMAALWKRAPLLVLLLAWLAVGTAGGVASWMQQKIWPDAWSPGVSDAGFAVWALGFLALVLFGFYIRVRNARW